MFICIRHSVVHSRSHSQVQWQSAVHGSSALMHLHLPAQPISLLQPHFDSSVMPGELSSTKAFTQSHSLGPGNGGKWYLGTAPAVASMVSGSLCMLTYYASLLSTTPRKFRLSFDISSGSLNVSNGNTSMIT